MMGYAVVMAIEAKLMFASPFLVSSSRFISNSVAEVEAVSALPSFTLSILDGVEEVVPVYAPSSSVSSSLS